MKRSLCSALLCVMICVQGLQSQTVRQRPGPVDVTAANWKNKPMDLALDETNQAAKIRRLVRGGLFDDRTGTKKPLDAPAPATVAGGEGHSSGLPLRLSPLPIAESDAVVVGVLSRFQPYLSNDRTSIYHEFEVSLSDVLVDKRSVVHPAQGITIVGGGGSIRLPDGRILRQFVPPAAENDVQVGRKYVLFLKYLADGEWFVVIKAWELRDGRVVPMAWSDIRDAERGISPYVGMQESVFLEAVRQAVQMSN